MKEVKEVLGDKILVKLLEDTHTTAAGLEFKGDGMSLPIAQVVLVSKSLSAKMADRQVEWLVAGNKVHYTAARESGKCRHNGEEHFIIPFANIVAILDE